MSSPASMQALSVEASKGGEGGHIQSMCSLVPVWSQSGNETIIYGYIDTLTENRVAFIGMYL